MFAPLPLGSVRPRGWLLDQLRIAAEGLTGHLDEDWPDVGPTSGWLGGPGEGWERGPYYLDGLVPLAHLLGDARLIAKADRFIDWILSSQRPDGFFGPPKDDWWPRMVAAKVLTQHAEATGDRRVVPFLQAYFRHLHQGLRERPLRDWGQARAADNVLSVYWLHERTGEPWLLDLAADLFRQSIDWSALYRDWPYREPQTAFDHRIHVVNVAMSLKFPGVRQRLTADPAERRAIAEGMGAIWRHHGQAHGLFAGDEWLAGTDPARGVETCAVVETMFSLENLVAIYGEPVFADLLERIAFNPLPASQSPDLWLHQYDQQANQVGCTLAKRAGWSNNQTANLFGLEPNFGCCTANLHQGWPKFVAHLWGRAPDGGLAALAYGPSTVRAEVGGVAVEIEEQTVYPFGDEIRFTVRPEQEMRLALQLRVPEWCSSAECTVVGEGSRSLTAGAWHAVDRVWRAGDTVVLRLPMDVRTTSRPSGAVAVERGPLVFALPVGERWVRLRGQDPVPDDEVHPETPWNYGLAPAAGFRVETGPLPRQPFSVAHPPVRLITRGRRIPAWGLDGPSAAPPPVQARSAEPEENITLVPYGCARLRVTELPMLEG